MDDAYLQALLEQIAFNTRSSGGLERNEYLERVVMPNASKIREAAEGVRPGGGVQGEAVAAKAKTNWLYSKRGEPQAQNVKG